MLVGEEEGAAFRGKKSEPCRCGQTIEAQPVSGQTCLIELADGLPETLTRRDMAMVLRYTRPGTNGILRHPPLRPSLLDSGGERSSCKHWLACPISPVRYRCTRESQPGGSIRQQTKPFIVERRPTRKPQPDAQKPSIWGRLDDDIAQGLKDQRNMEQGAATGSDDRA